MQHHEFANTVIPVELVYGDLSEPILAELRDRYQAEIGLKPRHWLLRVYSSGLAVPAPTQATNQIIPDIRVCQLFKQTLDKITRVQMRDMTEADTFNIKHTSHQLQKLGSLRAA
jgi:hypothetical protein